VLECVDAQQHDVRVLVDRAQKRTLRPCHRGAGGHHRGGRHAGVQLGSGQTGNLRVERIVS
jgi:hypothetical protein